MNMISAIGRNALQQVIEERGAVFDVSRAVTAGDVVSCTFTSIIFWPHVQRGQVRRSGSRKICGASSSVWVGLEPLLARSDSVWGWSRPERAASR